VVKKKENIGKNRTLDSLQVMAKAHIAFGKVS